LRSSTKASREAVLAVPTRAHNVDSPATNSRPKPKDHPEKHNTQLYRPGLKVFVQPVAPTATELSEAGFCAGARTTKENARLFRTSTQFVFEHPVLVAARRHQLSTTAVPVRNGTQHVAPTAIELSEAGSCVGARTTKENARLVSHDHKPVRNTIDVKRFGNALPSGGSHLARALGQNPA
jgi:hypothetical protein